MTYQKILVSRRGGPEVMQVVQAELRPRLSTRCASKSWPPQ